MATTKRSFLPVKSEPKTLQWLWSNHEFEEKYPALFELLAAGLYEGEPRKGATVTLFCVDGRLKACVSDRHSGMALWLTLEPFSDVLAEIELGVSQHSAEWKQLKGNAEKPVF